MRRHHRRRDQHRLIPAIPRLAPGAPPPPSNTPALAYGLACLELESGDSGSAPLPIQDIVREANATGRVLVVDETRSSGGVAEGVVTALVDEGFTGPLARVASEDSFIPLGDAALEVLLSEDTIEAAAIKLTQVSR